uniref:Transposable element Tc3 transposase n=1 Tax=Talaromyces marneffei PM1 TaxID=1077442 RepID=A0A093V492_TALMA
MAPRTPRTARRELDPCMRARICELHTEAHWGYKRIHKVHPEIPISTIRNTIKKEQERINQRSKARSGTPAKLTDEDKQKLIELTIQNPHIKYEELRNAVDNKVTIRTIQNMFQQIHKRKWKQRKRPEILPLNAQKRLAWALRYEAYTPREWQRILWTDECTVERDIMEWPPYSPDLNPIENIWAIMKTIIINDHPELQNAPDNDQTLYALIQAAKEAWQSIEIRVLKNLSNTMPNRVRAVIEADGCSNLWVENPCHLDLLPLSFLAEIPVPFIYANPIQIIDCDSFNLCVKCVFYVK